MQAITTIGLDIAKCLNIVIRLRPQRPNRGWSYDFVADRTQDGEAFRMLCVIDELSRENMAIRVARKLKATVIEALFEQFVSRGIPAHIR